jgi:hypothetical protein
MVSPKRENTHMKKKGFCEDGWVKLVISSEAEIIQTY